MTLVFPLLGVLIGVLGLIGAYDMSDHMESMYEKGLGKILVFALGLCSSLVVIGCTSLLASLIVRGT